MENVPMTEQKSPPHTAAGAAHVVVGAATPFSVKVSLLSTGQQSAIPIPGVDAQSAKLGDLRKAIQTSLRVPSAQQRLYFRGVELVQGDETTLASLGISASGVLQLAVRQGTVAVARPPQRYHPVLYSNAPEEIIPPMSEELAEKYLVMAGLARIVKILALIDIIFLLFYALVSWPFLLGLIAAMCGYYGATYYRPGMLSIYLMYVLALAGFRIWYFVEYRENFVYRDAMIVLTLLTVVLELWVASVIMRLLVLMCRFSPTELDHLAEVFTPDYGFWQAPTVVRVTESQPRYAGQRRGSNGQLYYIMEVPA